MLYEDGEQAGRSGEDNVTGQVLLPKQSRENLAEIAFSFGSSPGVVVPRRGSWPWGAGCLGEDPPAQISTAGFPEPSSPTDYNCTRQNLGCLSGLIRQAGLRGSRRLSDSILV